MDIFFHSAWLTKWTYFVFMCERYDIYATWPPEVWGVGHCYFQLSSNLICPWLIKADTNLYFADTKLSATTSTNKRIFSMNRSCCHLLSTTSRCHHEVVSSFVHDYFMLIEVSDLAELSVSNSLYKRIPSVNWSFWNFLSKKIRCHHEVVSCLLKVDSCTHSVIAGYWVGPDIDDGWGYIEAFVDSITWCLSNIIDYCAYVLIGPVYRKFRLWCIIRESNRFCQIFLLDLAKYNGTLQAMWEMSLIKSVLLTCYFFCIQSFSKCLAMEF